ncbi:uncharacterized protein EDB93DRAFT_1153932 [Suillus bovinus]|uniref:uncharacterized protein n=1 Tax=Suillus bovinus TaxID=48563 RepID=UPI001B86EA9A|nr:uncharacterized protein EDB93DRAFT_1153932 [Suillus bovinus]KAG2144143.1 hypothetical protein EDB93DRAFT_1153932 [Suillus bovinus]
MVRTNLRRKHYVGSFWPTLSVLLQGTRAAIIGNTQVAVLSDSLDKRMCSNIYTMNSYHVLYLTRSLSVAISRL